MEAHDQVNALHPLFTTEGRLGRHQDWVVVTSTDSSWSLLCMGASGSLTEQMESELCAGFMPRSAGAQKP